MSAEPQTPAEPNVVTRLLRLIRFSHTIFALPFALGALLVAADGRPTLRTLLLVLICMVLARTAAMLFNRLERLVVRPAKSPDRCPPSFAGKAHRLGSPGDQLD